MKREVSTDQLQDKVLTIKDIIQQELPLVNSVTFFEHGWWYPITAFKLAEPQNYYAI